MADTDNAAVKYVGDLQALRRRYSEEAVGELQTFFKRRDRKPPEEFHDSSFSIQ